MFCRCRVGRFADGAVGSSASVSYVEPAAVVVMMMMVVVVVVVMVKVPSAATTTI